MAIREINAAGGVNGQPVVRTWPTRAPTRRRRPRASTSCSTKDRVDAIVGPASSKVALALMDKIVDEKVVTCSPDGHGDGAVQLPRRRLLLPHHRLRRAAGQGPRRGRSPRPGARSTAIITPTTSTAAACPSSWRATLQAEDTTVTSTTSYDATATDFSEVVEAALADHPASVGGDRPARPRRPHHRRPRGRRARRPTSIFVTDGMRQPNLFDQVQQGHPRASPASRACRRRPTRSRRWFDDAFQAFAPNAQSLYAAYAYDCTNLIALAAQTAATDDPTTFVSEMVPTSRNGVSCRNFTDCAPVVADGRNIDLNGASGRIELLENGDASIGTYEVFVFGADGKDQTVKSKIDGL